MKNTICTAALIAFGAAMPALAQSDVTTDVYTDGSFCTSDYSPDMSGDQDEQSRTEFAAMDLDGDGMVSQDEYIECRKAATDGMSASGDMGSSSDVSSHSSDSSSTSDSSDGSMSDSSEDAAASDGSDASDSSGSSN